MSNSINPYRPPEADPAVASLMPPDAPTSSAGYWIAMILVIAASLAFCSFIGVLVRSSPPDRKAGFLLCTNLPTLVLWFVLTVKRSRWVHVGGIAAVVVQLLITLWMLVTSFGDRVAVININGIIMAVFGVVAVACYVGIARAAARQWKKGP